ncbi:MAG: beta-galactosidase, partial [Lentisphaeria bacterium]|nr:beta-galactosidase [Lentisphaeria bacterium]
EPLVLTVELYDSPFGRIWHRQELKVPAGALEVPFTIADYYMPTLAGYVRAEIGNAAGKPLAAADREIFFPDPSLDDYMQLGWDGPNAQNGELLLPQIQGRLGWNLQLTHPPKNARILAGLNRKLVVYAVRLTLSKSKKGGVLQSFRQFLPPDLKKRNPDLDGDECFYRPEVQEIWKKVIAHRISHLPKHRPAIYSLGDENWLSIGAGYGPSDEVYFRKFLKEKYGTIETLNYNWKSSYASFDEVPHPGLKEAKDAGNYAAWGDHRAYMEKMYADQHAFLRQEIRKYDPDAKVGAEGSVPGDLEQTIAPLEYWGPYSSLIGDEALRSFGRDKVRMLWWGGYPSSHSGRGRYATPLLRDLLRGTVNGNAWFAANPGSNHSAFACDLTIADYVKNYLYDLDRLKNGLAQLLIRNGLADTGAAFYWSHVSASANLLDPRCTAPNDGLIPLIHFAYRTGLGFEFISARTLDRLKNTKVLFLCGGSALSDRECAALLDFVKNGGTLIADMNPAIMNENLRVREKNPLSPLFGNITFDTVPAAQFKPLDLPGFRAARVPVIGKKIMEKRKYGEGKAVLCNFSFSSASNTASAETPFDGWVMSLLKRADAAPRFDLAGKADDNLLIRIREHRDFALLGVLVPEKQIGRTLEFDLKQEYFVYEADAGFLGKQKKMKFGFDKSPMRLYSLFRAEQKVPDFGIAPLRRGEWLKLRLPAPVSGRVYRLQLMDPAGKKIWTSVFDRAENAPKRAISYSEPAGQWTAVLTDVATGLSKTIRFEVK